MPWHPCERGWASRGSTFVKRKRELVAGFMFRGSRWFSESCLSHGSRAPSRERTAREDKAFLYATPVYLGWCLRASCATLKSSNATFQRAFCISNAPRILQHVDPLSGLPSGTPAPARCPIAGRIFSPRQNGNGHADPCNPIMARRPRPERPTCATPGDPGFITSSPHPVNYFNSSHARRDPG